jgi:HPt (histidine-containing phosphotransfer) domain-containing protein
METSKPSQVAEALDRLWNRFLPEIEERVAIIERAAAAIEAGSLTPELRRQAIAAAHKLAGTLGTFGLEEGTKVAREAEQFYIGESQSSPASTRPVELAAHLRAIVATRK